MKDQIIQLLERCASEEEVEILYACESGSRAWGFASPNSDYDIRFLYVSPIDNYLSVFEQKDTIEIPIKDDLDPGGWDVKKALGLLAKSNGALIEWLHSPIIYQNDGLRERWQGITKEILNPNHVINHYKGLAAQIRRRKLEANEPSAKGYLYACRALLAAKWVEERSEPPPVPFSELLETAKPLLREALEETVAWKAGADEVASKGRLTLLDEFISEELDPEKSQRDFTAPDPDFIKVILNDEFKRLIESTG